MHVLFVHKNFPAQFGHVARYLIERHGFRCTFVSELPDAQVDGIQRIQYKTKSLATSATHYCSRTFENYVWHSHAVYETLRGRPDIQPDLVVGHSGFGSTVFLRDLYDCPIINYFEWYYRSVGSDMDFRPEFPATELNRLRARSRNAMLLLDLQTCTLGYSPTDWQRTRFPGEYQPKLTTIFDGIDTQLWRPIRLPPGAPRRIGDRVIPDDVRIVTYVSRGFESMRGFDVFMRVAKRIYQEFPQVLFVCVGSDRICYGGDANHIEEKSYREHVFKQEDYDASKFLFTGTVPAPELARILNLGDLHVYLTVPFVLSWSMMNALACGATVLASSTPPVLEMITPGENGLLADFFDVERFAEQAVAVLRDPVAYRPLGDAAVQMIHERYSVDVCLPQMLNLYQRAQTAPPPEPPCSRQTPLAVQQAPPAVRAAPPVFVSPIDVHAEAPAASSVAPPERLLIQTVMMAPAGCEHVRVHQPNELLNQLPGVRAFASVRKMAEIEPRDDEQKIAILQRPILHWPECEITLRKLRALGFIIVVEYDDDPYRRPEHHANQFLTFRACHAVQTSTERLAAAIRVVNPHVAVFPNQIAALPPPREDALRPADGPVSIFFGAINREADWAPILPTFNEILREYGDRVAVSVVHDQKFFDALATPCKTFQPWCDYEVYCQRLRACDIGLLPLEPGRVNERKSDLKFIEHAAHGVVALASPTVYADVIRPGETGLIYHTASEFRTHLSTLLRDPERRRTLAQAAYAYVRDERQLAQHIRHRSAWYRNLVLRHAQLDAELLARTPELTGSGD